MKSIRKLDSKEKYIYMYTNMHWNMIDIPHIQTQTEKKRKKQSIDDKWWYGCDKFIKELFDTWNDMTIFITYQIHLSELLSSNQQKLFLFVYPELENIRWNSVLKGHWFVHTNTVNVLIPR